MPFGVKSKKTMCGLIQMEIFIPFLSEMGYILNRFYQKWDTFLFYTEKARIGSPSTSRKRALAVRKHVELGGAKAWDCHQVQLIVWK